MPTSRRAAKAEALTERAHDALDQVAEVVPAKATAVAEPAEPGRGRSKLPPWAQFPVAAVLSFSMASLGFSFLTEFTKGELASVSRSQDTWTEVGLLAGWRIVELALGWYGRLDSYDVAMMDLLSHGPTLFLLNSFYGLSTVTACSTLLVDILSAAVPFYLMRPLSGYHSRSGKASNLELVDVPLQILTTMLSTAIYTVTVVLSLNYLLPRILAVHFSGLPTLEPAYNASYLTVLPVTLAFGTAASLFIYTPYATAGKAKEDEQLTKFDPVEASLGQTVWYNIWGFTAKDKVAIRRTAMTVFVVFVNTYLSCSLTLYGIEPAGASAYAALWATSALFSGLGLGLVEGE